MFADVEDVLEAEKENEAGTNAPVSLPQLLKLTEAEDVKAQLAKLSSKQVADWMDHAILIRT